VTRPNPHLEVALRYARSGWPVFPVRADDPSCDGCRVCACKTPLTAHGFEDASTDPGRVERYWRRHPAANIGLATGTPGPDVLDVDVSHGKPGPKSLNIAIRAGLVPSPFATVRTPSGGSHLYYAPLPGQRNASLAAKGLDMRAEGGYVLAPPSRVHGRPYELTSHGREPVPVDFNKIRQHLQPQVERPPAAPRRGDGSRGLIAWLRGQRDGGRNNALFYAANRALENGEHGALDEMAAVAADLGLGQREISRTLDSARRTAQRQQEAG
jgi:hypothetical protein